MGAAVDRAQTLISLKAAATLSAYRIVRLTSANTVNLMDTTTSLILGVTTQDAWGVGAAVSVAIGGTVKVQCAASVSAGAMVTFWSGTTSGLLMEVGASSFTTTAASVYPKQLGIALAAGSTNSVIEVALQINNISKIG